LQSIKEMFLEVANSSTTA